MTILLDVLRYCQPNHIVQLVESSEHDFLTLDMLRGNEEGTLLEDDSSFDTTYYSPRLYRCDAYSSPRGR
jgi:hypothetical protein